MGYSIPVNGPESRPRGSEGSIGTAPVGSVEYTTTAPDQMERANAAQAAHFAANPVVARAPVQAAIADASNATGFGVQPGTNLNAPPPAQRGFDLGGRLSEMIDERAAARLADRAPVVTAAATAPRPPQTDSPIQSAMRAGQFSDARYESQRPAAPAAPAATPAAQPGPIGVARGGTMPAPMVGQPDPSYQPRTVESMRAELSLRNAQEADAYARWNADQRANAAASQNTYEAKINRENAIRGLKAAQSSILNRDKYGGYEKDYTAQIAALEAGIVPTAAPQFSGGRAVQDAIAVEEALNKRDVADNLKSRTRQDALTNAQALESGKTTEAINKLKLAQAKQMSEIHTKLLDPKLDPAEHARLSGTLLAILGKEKPDEHKVVAISLPDSVDPTTGAVVRGGQAAAIINSRTGAREIVRLDGSAPQKAQQAEPKVGATMRDANGRIGQYLGNGKWKTIE